MHEDDDSDITLDDVTLHALHVVKPDYKTMAEYINHLEQQEAIPPQQTNGNDRVSWTSSLGSPLSLPAAPSRPLYRLVQREGGNAPVGYSVLSDIAHTIRRTSERLARWRSGQRELRCMRARRLQLEREEWEA